MARSKKKTGRFNFELGLGGMAAVAVSTLCMLLWVFVLGFWMGQKMVGKKMSANEISLATAPSVVETPLKRDIKKGIPSLPETDVGDQNISQARPEPQAQTQAGTPSSRIIEEKITNEKTDTSGQQQPRTQPVTSKESSTPAFQAKKAQVIYFSLQIASYRERERANKEAARWARKGYFTQVKQADLGPKKGVWYRVYLGKFDSRRKARALAVRLADKEALKSYIVPLKN